MDATRKHRMHILNRTAFKCFTSGSCLTKSVANTEAECKEPEKSLGGRISFTSLLTASNKLTVLRQESQASSVRNLPET